MSLRFFFRGEFIMEILLWRELLDPYYQAVEELKIKFLHIIDEHKIDNTYSPIENVRGRVKTVTSILKKMHRKNIPMEELEDQMEDIAGIRIICRFADDIPVIVNHIKQRTDLEVKSTKDYIKEPKESGYRSYHMIIKYPVNRYSGVKVVQVELQIRTMAMNFWATTEHSLQYKYEGAIPKHISDKLSRASDAVKVLDNVMAAVRDEIMDAQMDSQIVNNLVTDILNNIENLYRTCSKREVEKIQDEFYRVFNMNDLDELKRFHKQLDILAEAHRAQSVQRTWHENI